jgi:hypothetical protein
MANQSSHEVWAEVVLVLGFCLIVAGCIVGSRLANGQQSRDAGGPSVRAGVE